MIISLTLKLTSPFLGSSKVDSQGIRKIIKSSNGHPALFIKRFCQLCKKYAGEMGIRYTNNMISVTNYIKTECKEELYQKQFKATTEDGKLNITEACECYPVGSVMTLECHVDTKQITVENAVKIIELIGKYDGVSQYGISKNFGRFDIILCNKENVG